jgi:hypothetical protein
MNTAPFETIPAWRIARLRTVLRDAEQRGANSDDEGHDLTHRALQRRFARARTCKECGEAGFQAKDHAEGAQLSAPETGHHLAGDPQRSPPGLEAGRYGTVWQHSQGA